MAIPRARTDQRSALRVRGLIEFPGCMCACHIDVLLFMQIGKAGRCVVENSYQRATYGPRLCSVKYCEIFFAVQEPRAQSKSSEMSKLIRGSAISNTHGL